MKIGITISFSENHNIFNNGIQLNALMLAEVLKKSKQNHEVIFLNGYKNNKIPWDSEEFPTFYISEKVEEMDLVIELGTQLDRKTYNLFKKDKSKRTVKYSCGNEYILNMERSIFGEDIDDKKQICNVSSPDKVWYVPQQHEANEYYYKAIYKCECIPVPFVYNPRWLQSFMDSANIKSYSESQEKKRISIMEPNINVVKYCMYPLLLIENFNNLYKDKIKEINIIGGDSVSKKSSFLSVLFNLNIEKDLDIYAEQRKETPYVLDEHSDILICHQLLNPLNYIYLDAAYMGYPVLHNAWMCSDIGYYYEGNNIEKGAVVLKDIIESHDSNIEMYKNKNKNILSRYNNDEIVKQYDRLLFNLFNDNTESLKFNFNKNRYE